MNLIKSQDRYTKQKLQKNSTEETVIIWFTFKPGLELTGFRTTQLCLEQFYLTWARDPIKNQHSVSGQLQ